MKNTQSCLATQVVVCSVLFGTISMTMQVIRENLGEILEVLPLWSDRTKVYRAELQHLSYINVFDF